MIESRALWIVVLMGAAGCTVEPSSELDPVAGPTTSAPGAGASGATPGGSTASGTSTPKPNGASDAGASSTPNPGSDAGSSDASASDASMPSSSNGPPLVQPPIANAAPGSWQAGDINGMSYQALFPHGYTKTKSYPLLVFLHQLDNASQIPQQIDPWFNDVQFRTEFPAIVVAPQCDQSADPSGQTINWGGVSNDTQPCQENTLALVDRFVKNESVYTDKIYVTGDSMGGIGSWDLMIKYNTKAPTVRPLFAASLILAGATYSWGYPNPNASVVTALKNVPLWAIHGANDDQVPTAWDQNMYAAQQAQGGIMKLTLVPNQGHDVWDDAYPMPGSRQIWTWLFAQSR